VEIATEPTTADARASGTRLGLILLGLVLGMLVAALDQTIVATALPTIAKDLHGFSHLSWVVTAYLIASTASTPLWGKLGDLYGRKGFFQLAIAIFLVGSALSGLSQNMLELILFRGLQGLGGGGLIVGAQAIIGDVVSPRERGKYQGIFGAISSRSSPGAASGTSCTSVPSRAPATPARSTHLLSAWARSGRPAAGRAWGPHHDAVGVGSFGPPGGC